MSRRLFASVSAGLFSDGPRAPETIGRFVLMEQIGAGGMGIVRSAYDPQLDRRVALKLIHPDDVSEQARVRLLREAQALARLSHPNVVQVHESGSEGDRVFIAMEYVVGVTMCEWIRREEPGWREIVERYAQAGKGLAAAHEAGLVHRDFKPENVLIGDDGRVRVTDFGLARGHSEPLQDLDAGDEDGDDDDDEFEADDGAEGDEGDEGD
ncbi:MAG: serine/threonine protein kinase, partial [Myxococcales bacterium]|nr:serine/threonine protein kinase [Myxococcales bacterium]